RRRSRDGKERAHAGVRRDVVSRRDSRAGRIHSHAVQVQGTRVVARRQPLIVAAVAVVAIVAAAILGWKFLARPVTLPAPQEVESIAVTRADFVGADACGSCHAPEYASWKSSTHGRAGGPPSSATVIAPFTGTIRFANARVTPRIRSAVYEFLVEQPGETPVTFAIAGVVGGGHIYGGGTQGYLTKRDDGTLRLLPFEWSRQAAAWFCNTNSRSGKGWTPIIASMRIEE